MIFNVARNRFEPDQQYLRQRELAKVGAIYKVRLLPRPYKQPVQRLPASVEVRYCDGFAMAEMRRA